MSDGGKIRVTVLGSGTSMGVPTLGCHCAVCESSDARDKRLRPSLLLSRSGRNVVIDTTPDFRTQALRVGLDRLDAVVLTHGHADHILGFDDLRPFNYKQQTPMPVYGSEETFRVLRRAFSYAFDVKPSLSSVPRVELHAVQGPFELMGVEFVPVPLLHGEMEVLGYRFGAAAYLTDFSRLPEESEKLLQGLDDLILDALRDVPHPMHLTVEQSLAVIERLKPKRAWFTHIAHDLGHAATEERLRKLGHGNVRLAFDGLEIEVASGGWRVASERQEENGLAIRSMKIFSSAGEWAKVFGREEKDLTQRAQRKSAEDAEKEAGIKGQRYREEGRKEEKKAERGDTECGEKRQGVLLPGQAEACAAGRGSVIAIGNFDGIHLGHRSVLAYCTAKARETGALATALTFEPPPLKLLRPESAPPRISTNEQRMGWFEELGIGAVVVLPFTMELSRVSAEDFVNEILVRQLQVKAVVVGENFRFGHKQAGNVKLLRELGMRNGFDVIVHEPVILRGEIVSSTRVRKLVAGGNVTHAGRLLGRPFVLTGEVVSGTGIGRKFTFPTLNMRPEQELLPGKGVYITRTVLEGETWSRSSVTNVGMRPTFDGKGLTVETHLLDYAGEFTGRRMEVQFWKRLREERKFAGAEELKAQIARDIAQARLFSSRLLGWRRGEEWKDNAETQRARS